MKLRVVPLTLKEANEFIARHHRHHKPVVGHRFTIGCKQDGLVGIAVTGRPVAREVSQYEVAEVTRLATDGTFNACSILYAASARAAQAMGFLWIQTYILESETGTSLRAAGWYRITSKGQRCECEGGCDKCLTSGGNWNHGWRKGRREDQPMGRKQRWGKRLNQYPSATDVELVVSSVSSIGIRDQSTDGKNQSGLVESACSQ